MRAGAQRLHCLGDVVYRGSADQDYVWLESLQAGIDTWKTLHLKFRCDVVQALGMRIASCQPGEAQFPQIREVAATYGTGASQQNGFYLGIRQGCYFVK
jgi:hypothetical protein